MGAGVLTLASKPRLDSSLLELDRRSTTRSTRSPGGSTDPACATTASPGSPGLSGSRWTPARGRPCQSSSPSPPRGHPRRHQRLSGLGPNLVALIRSVAGGSLVLLLLITAVSCIILGMGMPTTVTYIILVSMLGPALTGFGIPELAAHLFIPLLRRHRRHHAARRRRRLRRLRGGQVRPLPDGDRGVLAVAQQGHRPFAFVLTPGIVLLRENPDAADLPRRREVPGPHHRRPGRPDLGPPGGRCPGRRRVPRRRCLAATVIGCVYADVSRLDRALFALSSLLLMARAWPSPAPTTSSNSSASPAAR